MTLSGILVRKSRSQLMLYTGQCTEDVDSRRSAEKLQEQLQQ